MHKKFEINWTKIKGGCQSGIKVVTHNFKSDLPLVNCATRERCCDGGQSYLYVHRQYTVVDSKNIVIFRPNASGEIGHKR